MAQSETAIESAEEISNTIEDYLKAIYEECNLTTLAGTTAIAKRMGVTPASVTCMLKRLATRTPALVDYQKHRGAKLTPEGTWLALKIIRRHRLLELFLHEVLAFNWDEVHEEADRLEHVISEAFVQRIAFALDDPELDPHGHPIPTVALEMPDQDPIRLYDLQPGERGVVQCVDDRDPQLLRHLTGLGIALGTRLEVRAFSPLDENLTVRLSDSDVDVVLGSKITKQIGIQKVD
jgi:DtxR family Mn-dependent transcriptional regulator